MRVIEKSRYPRLDISTSLLNRGYRYAYSLTNDKAAAEDLLQDACLALCKRGKPWNVSYLFKTIRNRNIDLQRRRRIISFQTIDSIPEDDKQISEMLPEPDDEALTNALSGLKDIERELIFLNYVEGYSASELSKLTGLARGTVLSHMHRAKKKLRKLLGNPS